MGLNDKEIATQARDIILGQTRLVIATLSIEEINQDREKFLDLVNKNVSTEVNKIGLELINVNIRDITDESGYIEALGRKAASEAINQAKVEVAEADKSGSIGHATANRDMTIQVADQNAQSVTGEKLAERDQRVAVAKLEAEGVEGENQSRAILPTRRRRWPNAELSPNAAVTSPSRRRRETSSWPRRKKSPRR